MNTGLIILSILMFLAALSGWGTFWYERYTSNPKIEGEIFQVIIGVMDHPEKPGEKLTAFIPYLYLTNARHNSVHILDYEMEVDCGTGFEKLERVYGIQNVKDWGFSSPTHDMVIPDFNEKLIYREPRPVEYGSPIHGFIVFASEKPQSYYINEAGRNNIYRITCIDAFQRRHTIEASSDKFPTIHLLEDLAGIQIKKKS